MQISNLSLRVKNGIWYISSSDNHLCLYHQSSEKATQSDILLWDVEIPTGIISMSGGMQYICQKDMYIHIKPSNEGITSILLIKDNDYTDGYDVPMKISIGEYSQYMRKDDLIGKSDMIALFENLKEMKIK